MPIFVQLSGPAETIILTSSWGEMKPMSNYEKTAKKSYSGRNDAVGYSLIGLLVAIVGLVYGLDLNPGNADTVTPSGSNKADDTGIIGKAINWWENIPSVWSKSSNSLNIRH